SCPQGVHAEPSARNVECSVRSDVRGRKVRLHPLAQKRAESSSPAGSALAQTKASPGRRRAMNIYLVEQLARERVAEARAWAAQHGLVQDFAPARRSIRVTFGHALIRVGYWVAGREQRRTHAGQVTA